MTTPNAVALDDIGPMVDLYKQAKAEIKKWEEIAKQARSAIELHMGENETGTIDDKPVVKWTYVTSTRLDQTLVKGNFPEVFRECQTESTSRRFEPVTD